MTQSSPISSFASSAPTASFAFNLLRAEVANHPNENVLLSPLGASMALGMAANGARGSTLSSMIDTLGLVGARDSMDSHNPGYAHLLRELKGKKLGVDMKMANAIWAGEGIDFSSHFLQTCWKRFNAEVKVEDFADPDTLVHINDWSRNNAGIEKILDEMSPDAVMYLLNAIYFRGDWTNRFDINQTADGLFQTPGGSKKHPLMFRHAELLYGRNADYQLVALPFGTQKRLHLYAFLPVAGKTVVDVLGVLNANSYAKALADLSESEGKLKLPRFKLDYGCLLNDSLQQMGMTQPFNGAADFSGLGDSLKGTYISRVIQKCSAEFDEKGGAFKASTVVESVLECMTTSSAWQMTVDRPFVAVLGEQNTGAVIGAGVVYNP